MYKCICIDIACECTWIYVRVHACMCACVLMCVHYMYAGNFWCIRGCVFSHKSRAMLFIDVIFVAMGYWNVQAAILAVCRRFGNRRLLYASLRFVSWQELLSPYSFGTFSISFFSLQFVISENNPKIISLVFCFELPENLVPRLHKAQHRNWHYMSASQNSHEIYTCATKNPQLGIIFRTGKQTNRKTSPEILKIVCFFSSIFSSLSLFSF